MVHSLNVRMTEIKLATYECEFTIHDTRQKVLREGESKNGNTWWFGNKHSCPDEEICQYITCACMNWSNTYQEKHIQFALSVNTSTLNVDIRNNCFYKYTLFQISYFSTISWYDCSNLCITNCSYRRIQITR